MGSCLDDMTDEDHAELTRLHFAGELTPEKIAERYGVGEAAKLRQRVAELEEEGQRLRRERAELLDLVAKAACSPCCAGRA